MTYQPMDRQELDRSGPDRRNFWAEIAESFNDYHIFVYQNATVMSVGDEERSVEGMEQGYLACKGWNPSNSASLPARDAAWIRGKLNELRTSFTRARDNSQDRKSTRLNSSH